MRLSGALKLCVCGWQHPGFKIPGKAFQANTDVVKTVELGFTKGNELFVGRYAQFPRGGADPARHYTRHACLAPRPTQRPRR